MALQDETGAPPIAPLLRVSGVVKAFPGLTALDHVDLEVAPGEIVAVLGHNGSGKSTLIKILAGAYSRDAGTIETAPGTELHFIHQDLALVEQLSATENLALRRDEGATALAPYSDRRASAHARELIARVGSDFDVDCPLHRLTPAQRAVVAISRALDGWTHPANVLFLDEPTESLHRNEVEVLFQAVRRLAAQGTGVVFVSHRLDEVLRLADRVVVLRNGIKVADEPATSVNEERLVTLITGVDAGAVHHSRSTRDAGEPVLSVRGLRGQSVDGLDLDLRAGEIVGVAGVLGSGREAVPALLFGAAASTADAFTLAGDDYADRSPAHSLRRGVAFAPGDRARLGMIGELTARESLALAHLWGHGRFRRISPQRERARAERMLVDSDVRPARTEQRMSLFSGGNQQKVVMATALQDRPRVLLLDEPTQGVDVGAKAAIYLAIERGAAAGSAVLVSSSDAKELLTLCDRVVVMREGRAAAVLSGQALTEHRLVAEGYGIP